MRVFIGGLTSDKEVSIQIMPNKKETQDETLDTFSFACVVSDKDTSYDPNTLIYLRNDTNTETELELMLVSDNVEVASFNPIKYLHNISAVQNTRKFSKQLIRNSVFSQPFAKEKSSYNAATFSMAGNKPSGQTGYSHLDYKTVSGGGGSSAEQPNYVSEALHLTINEKAKNIYVKIDVRCVKSQWITNEDDWSSTSSWYLPNKWSELFNNGLLDTIPTYYILHYKNNVGDDFYYNLVASDFEDETLDFEFGKKIRCFKIETLASQGCTDFEILFPTTSSDFINKQYTIPDGYGITGDFLTIVFVQMRIVADIYYHTAYDVLEAISQRHQQKYKVESFSSGEYEVVKREPLWDYESSLITTLQGVYPPNLTFTQLTAFECCAEVFRLLDATFTLSTDGKLDIEYFNDWDTNKYNADDIKMTGRNLAIGEDRYTNGLITYYQDGRAEIKTDYIPMRNDEVGVPSSFRFGIKLPFPVQIIDGVFVKIGTIQIATDFYIQAQTAYAHMTLDGFEIDISYFFVEESFWNLLNTSIWGQFDESRERYQINTIAYTQGSDYIDCSLSWQDRYNNTRFNYQCVLEDGMLRYAGFSHGGTQIVISNTWDGNNYTNMFTRLNYTAYVDGRTKIETLRNKYDGETLVDQYNGAVDLNKMGVNLLGLSLKMGEPTLNISQKICNWEDRIKKGEIYIYDNAYWIANVCAYQLLPNNKVKTTVSFVKNFNALSLNTRLLREKRLSNVSSTLTQKSEDNIVEYVYFTDRDKLDTITNEPLTIYHNSLMKLIGKSLGVKTAIDDKIHSAYIKTDYAFFTYLPLHKYGAGNMVCFEMTFNDPKVAGYKTTKKGNTTWLGADGYFTEPVYYADENTGFLDIADIFFVGDKQTPSSSFPEMNMDGTDCYGAMLDYEVQKQPNEVFALNYQLCFLPLDYQNNFVSEEFINHNAFVDDNFAFTEKLYLYYKNDNFVYSQLDRKAHGDRTPITLVSRSQDLMNRTIKVQFDFAPITSYGNIKNFAIAKENGDILFAFNNSLLNNSNVIIYFYTRQTRIK